MLTRRQALVAGLTLLPTTGFWKRASAAPMPQYAHGQVRLPSGRRIGYAEYGDPSGPLVFYFHGTPGSRIEGGLIADEAMAAGIRLVALERPGIGLSDYQPGRQILSWPADVASAAEALGYGGTSFGLVGLSGGAPYRRFGTHSALPSRRSGRRARQADRVGRPAPALGDDGVSRGEQPTA
jgi:hypothetical protein